jgi:Protein of unknown function with HXXEE motif
MFYNGHAPPHFTRAMVNLEAAFGIPMQFVSVSGSRPGCPSRAQLIFLCLILSQGAHSIEEYVTKLYEVFAPARFVSSLVSQDLALGFVVVNAALVAFGLWCWAIPVRSGWQAARGLMWFWTVLEICNGVGHSALALSRQGYFPGFATAPLLLFFAGWLAVIQTRKAAWPEAPIS